MSVIIGLTVALNLFVAKRWDPIFFFDAEFTYIDQLQRDRSDRIWDEFAGVLLADRLRATEFLCVPTETELHNRLIANNDLTGFVVNSECEPLDFTQQPGNPLPPQLVAGEVAESFLYAYDPNYTPEGNRAILVETQSGVFVLIHTDTLDQLGLLPQEIASK
jgi:hypothetical protein